MSPKQTPQQPVKEFRAGTVSAAIWRNERADGERTVVQHTVRIQKRYRDQTTGEWKNSDYLFPNDLPKVALVVNKAYEFISLREREDGFDPQAIEQDNE